MTPSNLLSHPVLPEDEAAACSGAQSLRALVEALPLAVFEFRQKKYGGLLLHNANAAARRLAGLADVLCTDVCATEVLVALAPTSFLAQLLPAACTGAPVPPCRYVVCTEQGKEQAWEFSAYHCGPGCVSVVVRDISETIALAEARRTLNEQTDVFNAMESMAGMGSLRRRPDDPENVAIWSSGLHHITGIDGQALMNMAPEDSGILAEDLPAFQAVQERMDGTQVEFRFRRPDGELRWLRAHLCRTTTQGNVPFELGVVLDVTEQRRMATQLQEQLDFIHGIASRVPGIIYQYRVHEDGELSIPYISHGVNKALEASTQKAKHDLAVLTPQVVAADRTALRRAMEQCARSLEPLQVEYRVRKADGSERWHLTSAVPQAEPDGTVLLHGYTQDITGRKRAEQEIERLAFYDLLTGLPNRRLLLDRLHRSVLARQRSRRCGALLFIDLDNFKDLNDTLGHDMGDKLLVQVAGRLVSTVRECDTVARFGGDEFVVMLEGASLQQHEACSQAEAVAKKLLESLGQPYDIAGQQHYSTPSIGLTLFGQERLSVDELLKRADLAMYQAKAAGRNTYRFFSPGFQTALHQRSSLESDLRQALAHGELFVHYQPVVDRKGRALGAEALARWHHPERGLVSPGEFIALAEQTGLILPLGRHILRTACEQLARWGQRNETSHLSLAVNISARQFRQPGFVAEVLQTVRETGANVQRLRLELTESQLLGNIENAIARMAQLKDEGVSFSLDDFGTGYSSLSYLKRLPLSQVKIDRSFVRDVQSDPNDAAIVRTILALAQSLELDVVAEGVETQEQFVFLQLHGCEQFQGYLFGHPGPVEAMEVPAWCCL